MSPSCRSKVKCKLQTCLSKTVVKWSSLRFSMKNLLLKVLFAKKNPQEFQRGRFLGQKWAHWLPKIWLLRSFLIIRRGNVLLPRDPSSSVEIQINNAQMPHGKWKRLIKKNNAFRRNECLYHSHQAHNMSQLKKKNCFRPCLHGVGDPGLVG